MLITDVQNMYNMIGREEYSIDRIVHSASILFYLTKKNKKQKNKKNSSNNKNEKFHYRNGKYGNLIYLLI